MIKMSASFVKGTATSIKHNNRDFKEKDWETKYHNHINREREKDNKYLQSTPIREKYDELFGEEVERYNATQKRKDRKIDDYFDKVKNDKTLNTQYEFIVQVGTKDDFDLYSNYKIANEILEEYTENFEDRNPHLKIYNAVIHNDEASPHLHLNVIPVAEGYKQGMRKRPAFNKAIEEQGFERTGDSRQVFRDWRNSELSEIETLMNKREIERVKVGTNSIQSMPEYKKIKGELEDKKNELERTKSEVVALAGDTSKKADISKLGAKYETKTVKVPSGEKFLGHEFTKTVQKTTGNLIISETDFKKLDQALKHGRIKEEQLNKILNTDIHKENKELKDTVKELKAKTNDVIDDYNSLVKDYNSLIDENKGLRATISDLREEIRLIYISTKEFLKGRTSDLQTFKSAFKDLIHTITNKIGNSSLENNFQKEYRKETRQQSRGMER